MGLWVTGLNGISRRGLSAIQLFGVCWDCIGRVGQLVRLGPGKWTDRHGSPPPIPLRVPSFLPSPCILLTRTCALSYLPRLFFTCSIDSSHATAPVERENQLYTCTAVALCLPLSVPSLLPYTLTLRRPSPHPQHTSPHVRCKLPSPLSPLPSPSPPLPPAQIPLLESWKCTFR